MRFIAVIFLSATACLGQGFTFSDLPFLAFGATNAPAGYLVSEDAEGTGTPSGWTDVESNGTADWDWVTGALAGTQSLKLYDNPLGGNISGSHYEFAAQSDIWVYFLFHPIGAFSGSSIIYNYPDADDRFNVYQVGGQLTLTRGGGATDIADVTLAADTTYHIWIHYKNGTGSDGEAQLYVSESATRPVSPNAEITGGAALGTVTGIYLILQSTSGESALIDTIRVDDVEIGDNPN